MTVSAKIHCPDDNVWYNSEEYYIISFVLELFHLFNRCYPWKRCYHLSQIQKKADRSSGTLAFDRLYELYATDVLRVSYYYLGNRELAEDVTQDVFVKLMTNCPSLEEGREKAWLLKVALNRCKDLWRSAWIKKVILGHPGFEAFPAPDEIGQMADQYALAEAVSRLKPEFKEVVLLFYYQGFSVAEIAEMLGIAEGTVSSRLSRARDKLQNELKGDDKQ